jgi:effector-binding domain-containing protein
MKILKYLLYVVAALVVVAVLLGLFGPKSYDVHRSAVVSGTPEQVWPYVSNLKNMAQWSPWAEKDTAMSVEYSGTDGAVGSMSSWSGNKEVGKGSQTLSLLEPNSYVESQLKFLEPMEGEAVAYTRLTDTTGGTLVTWGLKGENGFVGKIFASVMSMDKMMAGDFERGLSKLTDLMANMPKKESTTYDVMPGEYPGGKYLGIHKTVAMADISGFYAKSVPAIMTALQKGKGEMAGVPTGLYYTWDEKKAETDMAAAVGLKGDFKAPAGMEILNVAGGKSLTIEYKGGYGKMLDAHMAMDAHIKANKLEMVPPVIEEYYAGPGTEPDSTKWMTKIIYLVK